MSEWKNVKIGDICKIVKGTTGIASAEPGEYPLVVTAEERKTCSSYQFDCEAVCIPLVSSSGHGKKSLKNVHYQSGKFALGTILCAVIPINPEQLDARFLHQYLQFYKDTILVPLMKGAANVSLSMKDIATVEIPLPPIENQRELSVLFITLRENQKKLAAETDQQLEYTKLLRQNILQDAIEGKLTADWRKPHPVIIGNPDYDAEALFEKIQKEKSSDKKQKELPPITDEEKPFEIPEGWKWVRLNDFVIISTGNKDVNQGNEDGLYDFFTCAKEPLKSNSYSYDGECLILPGNGVNVGVAIYHIGKFEAYQRTYVLEKVSNLCNFKYLLNSLNCNWKKYNENKMFGTAMPFIKLGNLQNYIFPLPPLKEQEVIVTKAKALLSKVTELENQIQERKTLSEKLAFGIIKEKLEVK